MCSPLVKDDANRFLLLARAALQFHHQTNHVLVALREFVQYLGVGFGGFEQSGLLRHHEREGAPQLAEVVGGVPVLNHGEDVLYGEDDPQENEEELAPRRDGR